MDYKPSWRKPVGMFAIIGLIIVLAWLVGSFSAIVGQWHWAAQIPVYLVAGIIWILPLKPLLRWMEIGRWRD